VRRNEFESGGGHRSGAERRKNVFLVVPRHFFGSRSRLQLVVLVSAFVIVSTVCSVSCLLFYLRCPHAKQFVKVGARAPVPYGVGATVNVYDKIVTNNDIICIRKRLYHFYYQIKTNIIYLVKFT